MDNRWFVFTHLQGLVGHNITRGFRLKSFGLLLKALFLLKHFLRYRIDLPIFFFILINRRLRPWVYFRIARFRGRRITYVPRVLTPYKSLHFAFRWFFRAAHSRLHYSPVLRIFLEMVYTFYRKSSSIKLRDDAYALSFSYQKNIRPNYKFLSSMELLPPRLANRVRSTMSKLSATRDAVLRFQGVGRPIFRFGKSNASHRKNKAGSSLYTFFPNTKSGGRFVRLKRRRISDIQSNVSVPRYLSKGVLKVK